MAEQVKRGGGCTECGMYILVTTIYGDGADRSLKAVPCPITSCAGSLDWDNDD